MNSTILMVDDAPENLDVLKGLLSSDYKLKAAPNGKVAIKIANLVPHPDLILLDVLMPVMNGFEVLQELKRNPETKDIPVIMLTSLDSEENVQKGKELGAEGYISKPFKADKILIKIKELLNS